MKTKAYPLLFTPVYKDYLWGGSRIPRLFSRPPQTGPCAESWEIADRPEGMSVVRNGPWQGRTLRALIDACPGDSGPDCPILTELGD